MCQVCRFSNKSGISVHSLIILEGLARKQDPCLPNARRGAALALKSLTSRHSSQHQTKTKTCENRRLPGTTQRVAFYPRLPILIYAPESSCITLERSREPLVFTFFGHIRVATNGARAAVCAPKRLPSGRWANTELVHLPIPRGRGRGQPARRSLFLKGCRPYSLAKSGRRGRERNTPALRTHKPFLI